LDFTRQTGHMLTMFVWGVGELTCPCQV